jgi:hypothetical protein
MKLPYTLLTHLSAKKPNGGDRKTVAAWIFEAV